MILEGNIALVARELSKTMYVAIGHQVNAEGKYNAGVSRDIRTVFPLSFYTYRQAYGEGKLVMGECILKPVTDSVSVGHLVGQPRVRRYRGEVVTSVPHLLLATEKFIDQLNIVGNHPRILLPYGIGCGLGGANWKEVQPQMEAILYKYGNWNWVKL